MRNMLLALFCAAAGPHAGANAAAPQDLVVRGVTVHGDGAPHAGELRIAEGRILPDARAPEGARTIVLDGGHAYPGLVDAHGHLLGLGASLENVDLVGTRSYAEVIDRVRQRAAMTPAGEWIVGRGWDQNDWPATAMPDHAELSAALPDHPVWLTRIDGHAALVNAAAMRLAKLGPSSEAPAGGEILRREDGTPTGVLVDNAMALVGGSIPAPNPEQVRRRLLAAQAACLRVGLTGVHDAGMTPDEVEVLRELHVRGEWRLRTYVMLAAGSEAAIRRGPWQTPDRMVTVRAAKGYADGALGSRGAALLAPYADRPTWRGLLTSQTAAIARLAQLCADHGFQLCVHAIGDAANRAVLDAYGRTRFPHGAAAARFRIEHAQVVAPEDFARFAAQHVIASMQPTHLTSDMPWAPARLGQERVRGAYAWRTFLDAGVPLAFGSDFPVESHDPRLGLYAAVTTRAADGSGPAEGFRPEQKLTRAEALAAFTRGAAYASFAEHELGAIRPNFLADLTVFDRDLLTCSDAELLQAKVLLTVVGGRVAFAAGE